MSTEYECFLVVGNDLSTTFRTARDIARDLGKSFPYNAPCEWRDSLGVGFYQDEFGFFGLQVTEDNEEVELWEDPSDESRIMVDFEAQCAEAKSDFEKATGVVAKLKPIIFKY